MWFYPCWDQLCQLGDHEKHQLDRSTQSAQSTDTMSYSVWASCVRPMLPVTQQQLCWPSTLKAVEAVGCMHMWRP